MTTIDIDETTRNAILAALDERAARLDAEVLTQSRAIVALGDHVSENRQRALVWNIAALHETNMARLLVSEAGGETLAEAVPWEPAEPWTDDQRAAAAGSFHDWQSGR